MKYLILILIVLTTVIGCTTQTSVTNTTANTPQDSIKIGIITDLSGPASYWGESTRFGASLAQEELNNQGYDVTLVFETYPLDAKDALSAAQKLLSVDNVDAIYSEFNPGAIAVSSLIKGLPVLHVYDAAVVSPLENAPYTYKTYLDYQAGCKELAQRFKDEGVAKMGVLKIGLEAGELCLTGVKEVYDMPVVEFYELGDQDFRTQFLRFKDSKVEAVINVGFEGDTLNSLKVIKEQDLKIRYGTVEDTITTQVIDQYQNELKGSLTFGFVEVNPEFRTRMNGSELSTEYGAALAYTHIQQMVHAVSECDADHACIINSMDAAMPDATIGFKGFKDHIAILETQVIIR